MFNSDLIVQLIPNTPASELCSYVLILVLYQGPAAYVIEGAVFDVFPNVRFAGP